MREGWKIKNIGEVSKILNGGTPKTKIQDYWDGNIAWITPADLGKNQSKYVSNTSRKITKLGLEKSSAKLFPSNSIVLSTRAPIGHIAINTVEMCTNQGCRGIVPSEECETEYLFYFLYSNVELLNSLGTGATFRELSTKALASVSVPIPSFREQKQIVSILDKAFVAIEQAKTNIERNIENAKELFQSKLNEIFSQKGEGWEEKKLGNLGILTSSKRIFKKEYVGEGVPFYRSKEIKELAHDKEISLELFITKERYLEIKSQFGIPQAGDILLTAVGTIGEMYVVQEDEEFYFKDGNIMWLKDFKSLNTYYLKYALTSYVEQLKAMSRGSAYSALTIEKLKQYHVPVPPQNVQTKIVCELDILLANVNDSVSAYQRKLVLLEEFKSSILQKAFAGELTEKTINLEKLDIAAEPVSQYQTKN